MQNPQWIWIDAESRADWCQWVEFKRSFLAGPHRSAVLRITADTRYNVWLNGTWVGYGPNRSFPDRAYVDEYDVTALVSASENTLDVLVHATGIATFQNLESNAGLWAELEVDGEKLVVSDDRWQCRRSPRFMNKRFRIACQQGWQELVAPESGNCAWVHATVVDDERILERSPVQMSVNRVLIPVGVKEAHMVRPPAAVLSIALREVLLPGYTGAAPQQIWGAVGFLFHVKHSQPLHIDLPGTWFWVRPKGFINGEPLTEVESTNSRFENGCGLAGTAQKGANFLVLDVSGFFHEWHLNASLPDLDMCGDYEILVAGPFADHSEVESLLRAPVATWRSHPSVRTPPSEIVANVFEGTPFPVTAYAKRNKPIAFTDAQSLALGAEETQAILDLGEMTVGFWEYEIEAREPGVLRLNGFEAYQEDEPDFCWEMSNTIEHRYDAGVTRHRSPIRRGGRYIAVQGRNATIRNFRVYEHTASLRDVQFECSDTLLNRIWEICVRTARLCAEDTFVDCPTYEQTFWVGDARNEALVLGAAFGDWSLARRCWLLAAESLQQGEFVMSHVPSGWAMVIPAWSFLWAIGCWEYYTATLDKPFLEAVAPALETQMKSTERYLDSRGLFSIEAWNLCEWSGMDQPGIGVVTHNQGWAAMALSATESAFKELHKPEIAAKAAEIRDRIQTAVNNHLWCDQRQAYSDCEKHDTGRLSDTFSIQTQVVTYLSGMVPPERAQRMEALISGQAEDTDTFVQVGTPFFLFFVFEALERMGRYDLILHRIRETWGMMLDRGATTCWELLPGFMPGGRWTRSHCHAWSAGPAYFISRLILGLRPEAPGMRSVRFQPFDASGVEWARGEFPTPFGRIGVEWSKSQSGVDAKFEVPDGVEVSQYG